MKHFQRSAARLVNHFAGGTTVKIFNAASPATPPIAVPAVFPEMTFDEKATLGGAAVKIAIAKLALGLMPLDGRSVIELAGGRQYSFIPLGADGARAPASLPGDSQALIEGYIQAGAP